MSIEELIEKLGRDFQENGEKYEPFIRHVRFPKYKNLKLDSRLQLDSPITVLVGANGSNKSSVLRALYGAPAQKSLGDYWFETKIDKIKDEKTSPSCFIYGYFNQAENKIVEVLKTRVKKGDDPDYWEPSRPLARYGMEKFIEKTESTSGERAYRHRTRWKAIEKGVVYLDFRHEAVSAYDRFFYGTPLHQNQVTIKQKKENLRRYSTHLRRIVDQNLDSYKYYGAERVGENRLLEQGTVKSICKILGKEYASIRVVSHSMYTNSFAKTVLLSSKNKTEYSEAFAGSGEFAVVCLVDSVTRAPERALILLDEPEVSIHPQAQKRLLEFLVCQTLSKKLQVVLATHSPYFVEGLSSKSIKLFFTDAKGESYIKNNVYASEAFLDIGVKPRKIRILVEDICAKSILEACLRNTEKDRLFDVISVDRYGSDGILSKDVVSGFTEKTEDIIYCLDGDQRQEFPRPEDAAGNCHKLEELARKIIPKLSLTQSNASEEEKIQKYSDFLRYLQNNVFFLPGKNEPEEIIWSVIPSEERTGIEPNNEFKEAVRKACKGHFCKDDSKTISSYINFYAASLLKEGSSTCFADDLKKLVDKLVLFADKFAKS